MAAVPPENGVDGDDEREEEEEDEEEEEEEEEEENGDEAEEEPRLKYQRMGGNVPALLSNDAASCIAVAARMIALGTHDGTVRILDLLGNQASFPLIFGISGLFQHCTSFSVNFNILGVLVFW
jgi:hypothetical protein